MLDMFALLDLMKMFDSASEPASREDSESPIRCHHQRPPDLLLGRPFKLYGV